jgi:glycosyltransferase involved in cell wall biosynthesis
LSQTHTELQVVAINDGSTDKSATILNEYASRDSRLQVVHRENRGVATTRLELLSLAKGEYIHFVDADDAVQPDMIERMVYTCEQNQLDMLVCQSAKNMNLSAITESDNSIDIIAHDAAIREFLEHRRLVGALWSKLIRRELCQNLHCPSDISYGEDAYICWQILQRINRLGFINAKFYHYRTNDASISHLGFDKNKYSAYYTWNYIVSDVEIHYTLFRQIAYAQCAHQMTMLIFDALLNNYADKEDLEKLLRPVRKYIISLLSNSVGTTKSHILALMMVFSLKFTACCIRRVYGYDRLSSI